MKIRIEIKNYSKDLNKELIYKMAYISDEIKEITLDENYINLKIAAEKEEILRGKINNLICQVEKNYRYCDDDIIFENKVNLPSNIVNVYDELVKKNWIIPYEKGLVGYGREFLSIFKRLDNIFIAWAEKYKAIEYSYPDLISIQTLNKYNYLREFPNHLLFSFHLKEDMAILEEFSENIKDGKEYLSSKYIA